MAYIQKKAEEVGGVEGNPALKALMYVVNCCLWCFEKIVRYLSRNAYIMIAIEGKSFCTSAWRSFKLVMDNALAIGTTQTLAVFVLVLCKAGVTMACVMACFVYINNANAHQPGASLEVSNPLAPCFLVAIVAYTVVGAFTEVYSVAIDTILLSWCVDDENSKQGAYLQAVRKNRKQDERMYAALNGLVHT